MGLDTKYRPHTFEDVLGQESAIKVIKRFVETKQGFQQSYLFCGPYGSGKTTLGRILARALLCDNPQNGNPCDQCDSCLNMLSNSHECFIEVDAATNSGKGEIKKIVSELDYSSFSGKKTLYLFDESHQLSKDALDALLKPLEENMKGSEDKKLVCIFCTTEPEKMRATILSRCAPAFVIHPLSPQAIADRLAYVCDQEKIEYDKEVLPLIAEMTECHIRDALKAIEGVSMLGKIDRENVNKYLHLDLNNLFLDIIDNLESDLDSSMRSLKALLQRTSPSTCYERLANVSLYAYKVALGLDKAPVYWDSDRLKAIGQKYGNSLIGLVSLFSSKPRAVTEDMLVCDLISQHLIMTGELKLFSDTNHLISANSRVGIGNPLENSSKSDKNSIQLDNKGNSNNKKTKSIPPVELNGVHIDRRAVLKDNSAGHNSNVERSTFTSVDFGKMLTHYLKEVGC